jgi:hypothetical protein
MVESTTQSTASNSYNNQLNTQNRETQSQTQSKTEQKPDTTTTEEQLKNRPTRLEQSLGYTDSNGSVEQNPATTSSAVDSAAITAGGVVTTLEDGFKALQVDSAFQQLNSDGDKLYMRMTGELKGSIQVGLKGQLGADIEVTRIGDGADADYRVTLDKESLAALTGQLSIPYLPVKLEAGLQTADRVEMTFDNQEEAIRATKLLQRLAVADVASDATSSASDGGANPLANPLTESGSPGSISTAAVGLQQDDLTFLQNHITAYEQKIGLRGRAALEAQAPQLFLPFKASAEGRFDPRLEVTRRTELPQDGKPGELTYTVSGDVRLSAKEKIATDPLPTNQFDAAILAQNRLEIGTARIAVSAHYALDAEGEVTKSDGGRPAPEYDGKGGYNLGDPDKISVETSAEWRVQGLTDLSRGDTNRTTARFEITDMSNSKAALEMLASGDVSGAASTVDAKISTSFQQIERSGFALQSGFNLKVLEGNQVEATVILEAGVDDIISSQQSTITADAAASTANAEETAAPTDDGKTLVVTPREGVILRDAPFGQGSSIVQHGTFLQQTGEPIAAIDGSQWIPITGTDVNDQPVNGYIYEGFVKPHDSSQGAMDENGRTNPTLEHQRYDEVTVRDGDNLWDIAKQNELPYDELVALNSDHLISPDLIFAGDTVYLPGTAKGAVETSTQTETEVESATPAQSPDTATPISTAEPDIQESGRSTDEILKQYQVADDEVLEEWSLSTFGGLIELGSLRGITKTEAELMQQLYDSQRSFIHGASAISTFKRIVDSSGTDKEVNAYRVADQYFPRTDDKGIPIPGVNDGHNDAFRHAFYNAMLTKEFGVDFAAAFGTAHEGKPGNEADREAMDLYNNELGREIAEANPDATPQELAELIFSAIQRGEALVIDRRGELVFSNEEEVGRTGKADDAPVGGVMTPPKWNTES